MVFWAWSEHKKALERFRNEGRAEGRAEGRQEAAKEYEQKIAQQQAELAAARAREDAIRERARAEGIDIDRLLNS